MPTEASADAKIWRYMDLLKLVGLLDTAGGGSSKLYFSRLRDFDDIYEGQVAPGSENPPRYNEALSSLEERRNRGEISTERYATEREILDKSIQGYRRYGFAHRRVAKLQRAVWETEFAYACSWHINDHESHLHWQIYAERGSGICVESTKERLQQALGNRDDSNLGFSMERSPMASAAWKMQTSPRRD